jgi:hypothetical protein
MTPLAKLYEYRYGCSPRTARRWVQQDRIPPSRFPPQPSTFAYLAAGLNPPVPPNLYLHKIFEEYLRQSQATYVMCEDEVRFWIMKDIL